MALTSRALAGYPYGNIPDPHTSRDHPNRYGYVPASFSHPACDPPAAERPTAPPMHAPVFRHYYAQETGVPRIGSQPDNPCVRATAGDFYLSQLTRGARHKPGVPGQVPHCGYLASSMDPD
eukprot:2717259-Pyramimonas_sp.AAC.1